MRSRRETVFCYNTQNSFWLAKAAGDSEYLVNLFDTGKDERSRVRYQVREALKSLSPFRCRLLAHVATNCVFVTRIETGGSSTGPIPTPL